MCQGAFARKYQCLAERLRASTQEQERGHETPCWEWTGVLRGRTGNYPRVNVRMGGRHRQYSAHCLAKAADEAGSDDCLAVILYDLYKRYRIELDHECENPRCIRPSHTTWRGKREHLKLTVRRRRERRTAS